MSFEKSWLVISILIFLQGCLFFPSPVKIDKSKNSFNLANRIIDPQRLKQGGGLIILPFKAGSNVEASDKLDAVSLEIVKGVSEYFSSNDTSHQFRILAQEQSQQAAFIIKGYITSFLEPQKGRLGLFRNNRKKIAIESWLIDAKTQKKIVYFREQKESKEFYDDLSTLGHSLGQQMAKFISS